VRSFALAHATWAKRDHVVDLEREALCSARDLGECAIDREHVGAGWDRR
jgi:hypothetical protein